MFSDINMPIPFIAPDARGGISFTSKNVQNKMTILNGESLILLPGFFDTHIHGVDGYRLYNLSSAEEAKVNLIGISRELLKYGITSFLPTTITEQENSISYLFQAINQMKNSKAEGAKIEGIHLEGPFLNPAIAGAHEVQECRKTSKDFISWMDEEIGSEIKILTADPSMDINNLLPDWSKQRGFKLSFGHTAITGNDLSVSSNNYSRITHIFNALNGMHHRENTLSINLINRLEYWLELIIDGHMVHPTWVKLVLQARKGNRVIAASDCIHVSGRKYSPIISEFNNTKIRKNDKGWVRAYDSAVWAPSKCLDDSLRFLRSETDLSWDDIAKVLSINAFESIGSIPNYLMNGQNFTAVAVTEQGTVVATILKGKLVYLNSEYEGLISQVF